MRVPLLHIQPRLLLAIVAFFAISGATGAAPLPPPPVGEPAACAAPVAASVYLMGQTVVVDRRALPATVAVSYRIDDEHGYWTFPPTTAPIALLDLDAVTVGRVYVSVDQVAEGSGTVTCFESNIEITGPLVAMSTSPPPGAVVQHLTPGLPTVDPISCEKPFLRASMIDPAPIPPALGGQPMTESGRIDMDVEVGADGHVLSAVMLSGPDTLYAKRVLAAARASTYSAAIFRCLPVNSHTLVRLQYRFR
jgi:hypothetical protein